MSVRVQANRLLRVTWHLTLASLISELIYVLLPLGGIYIQGPSEPVLENTEVVLECMSTDPGVDLSQVHLRKLTV